MKKQMKIYGFNCQIVKLTILGLLILAIGGCQQVGQLTNSNTNGNANTSAGNTNAPATNANANAFNANSNANASNANANSSVGQANTAAEEKSPEIKAFENNLIGTWAEYGQKRVFTKDHYIVYQGGKIREYFPYRILDKETVEMLGTSFTKDRIKITFKDNNSTLDWRWSDGNGFEAKRESDKTDVIADDSLNNKLIGAWVGISGTNSDKEKILFYIDAGNSKNKLFSIGNGGSSGAYYTVQANKTVVLENGMQKTMSVEGNVLTVEENGVTKKYNRLKTVE